MARALPEAPFPSLLVLDRAPHAESILACARSGGAPEKEKALPSTRLAAARSPGSPARRTQVTVVRGGRVH